MARDAYLILLLHRDTRVTPKWGDYTSERRRTLDFAGKRHGIGDSASFFPYRVDEPARFNISVRRCYLP